MESKFPAVYSHLQELLGELSESLPEPMEAFTRLHKSTTAEGELTRKTKELIALGIAMSANCDGCVAYHVKDAIAAGASRNEILETIGVAVMMGGGPAVVYGCQALEALDQLEPAQVP